MGQRWVWLAALGGISCTQAPPLPSDPPGRTVAAASASAGRSEAAPVAETEAPRVDASAALPALPPAPVASGAAPLALTPGMVERFRGMLERSGGRPEVFAKVGDSITISGAFLRCLEGTDLRWGAHERLTEARDFFLKTRVDGRHTSFGRDTLAARVGWRTFRVLKGVPQPLAQELDALRPAWALVLLGTNDTYPDSMQEYERSYRAVVEALLARNVVPVLSTLPPRRDKQEARDNVPEMNAVVRLVARRHELPVMDLFQALDPLPRGGLQSDGVHPAAFQDDRAHPCWFDEQGLQAGMNRRNLLALEALDQLRRQVLGNEPAPARPASEQGDGTWERPWAVEAPGVWNASTEGGPSVAEEYGCGKGKLRGSERVHRVEVKGAGRLRVRLFGGGRRGLRWLKEARPEACVARALTRLDVAVTPGVYWLAVDGAGPGDEGPYGLTLVLRGDP